MSLILRVTGLLIFIVGGLLNTSNYNSIILNLILGWMMLIKADLHDLVEDK